MTVAARVPSNWAAIIDAFTAALGAEFFCAAAALEQLDTRRKVQGYTVH